jgi:hypothetical protein
MPTRKVFNNAAQQVEDAELTVDHNNEIVITFKDKSFFKLPAGLTKKEFEAALEAHEVHNKGKELVTPEMIAAAEKERAASLALIGESDADGKDKE